VPAKQEEAMKFTNFAVATVTLGLMLGSAAAYATDEASSTTCVQMESTAADAIRANGSSANIDAAKEAIRSARSNCNSGFYKLGVAQYKKVLELLGAG
jgi:hypothetical protein